MKTILVLLFLTFATNLFCQQEKRDNTDTIPEFIVIRNQELIKYVIECEKANITPTVLDYLEKITKELQYYEAEHKAGRLDDITYFYKLFNYIQKNYELR